MGKKQEMGLSKEGNEWRRRADLIRTFIKPQGREDIITGKKGRTKSQKIKGRNKLGESSLGTGSVTF